jgi:CheY-like chemotaxis protein
MKLSSRDRKASPSNNPRVTKRTILIIDSDPMVAALLSSYLEGEKGYAVLSAATGASGIRMAEEAVPDLILLDLRLADMDGLEVHEELRNNSATQSLPIVYVSSFFTLRTVEKATRKGARGFIVKPFTPAGVYTKVATVLGPA